MHDTVAQELGVLEAGDHGKDPFLFAELEVRLEAHEVVHGAFGGLLAELQRRPGAVTGAGVRETDGFHRAEPDGIVSPICHDFDGHAAFVDAAFVEVVEFRGLGGDEGLVEAVVLLLVHGTVDVIVLPAPVVTGLSERFRHVDGVAGHDGRHRVEEVERGLALRVLFGLHLFGCARVVRVRGGLRVQGLFAEFLDVVRQSIGGKGARRDDHDVRVDAGAREGLHLFAMHGDVRFRFHPFRDEF